MTGYVGIGNQTIVFQQAMDLTVFFGCSLHQVNRVVLRLAMVENPPEWLRACPKLHKLPRWNEASSNSVKVGRLTRPDVSERVKWIVEELHHGWALTTEGFWFEEAAEAVVFILKWS